MLSTGIKKQRVYAKLQIFLTIHKKWYAIEKNQQNSQIHKSKTPIDILASDKNIFFCKSMKFKKYKKS